MVRFMGLGFLILRNGIFSLSCSQGWRWLLWLKLLKFRRRSNITKWCFNMSSCRTRCRCGWFFLKWKAVKCLHRSSRARKGSRKTVIECWSSSWCEKSQVNWFLGQHVVTILLEHEPGLRRSPPTSHLHLHRLKKSKVRRGVQTRCWSVAEIMRR